MRDRCVTNETPGPCGTHRQHTILIVDDDPASRTCFVEVLEGLGHYPLQAADGGEALRILIETPPDLIFTDLMMPGMDGLEFLTLSRTHAPGLPLVLITACDQSEVADEALTCGAAGFLRKPVSLTDLTATLQRFLPTPASETSGSGPCPPVSTSRTCDGGMEVDSSRMQSLAGLDPSLLRKATQLSFLTRFASTLRLLPAAMGPRERQAAPPSMEFLVRRSLDVILRALAGNQAVMALTDDGRVQPIMASGRSTRQLPLETVTTHAREAGADHSWHGVVHGMPLLAAPLNIQGGEVGLICVGRDPGAAAFTWADRELLAAFSTAMAMTLENACLRRQLEQAFQETVTSLILTLEARDKYTEGHSLRVAKYACGIAGAQRLPPALREQIRRRVSCMTWARSAFVMSSWTNPAV